MADLELLYADHWAWLKGWLQRRTACAERAEDLAQDTFCRLLGVTAPAASPAGQIRDARAYLATLARRLLIDDTRRRKVEQAILAALAEEACADLLSPERIVVARQLLEAIARLLEALSPQAREAFLLRRVEGLEQREIATRLGISLSTVKRHIAHAYAQCHVLALD